MKSCQGCGVQFQESYPEQKYHSHPCFLSHNNRDSARQSAKAKIVGDVRGAQLTAQAQAEGYRGYVKEPDGSDRHQHRVVAERVLGRPLGPTEIVHHEDLDKSNNDPANLIVFPSQAEHARHHKRGHPGLPECGCVCTRLEEVMPNASL